MAFNICNLICSNFLRDNNYKMALVLPFLECGLPFLFFHDYRKYELLRSLFYLINGNFSISLGDFRAKNCNIMVIFCFFCHTNLEDKATFIEYSKLFRSQRRLLSHQAIYIIPEAKFKKFEPRFKFKPLLKYGWSHLNLCQFFSRYKRAVN